MKTVFSILSTLSFCFFLVKLFIHLFLDNKSGYDFKFSIFSAIQYFLLYDKEVVPELFLWKKGCNYFYKLFLTSFLACLIIGIFLKNL